MIKMAQNQAAKKPCKVICLRRKPTANTVLFTDIEYFFILHYTETKIAPFHFYFTKEMKRCHNVKKTLNKLVKPFLALLFVTRFHEHDFAE
jgi:hypothetical protein